MFSSLFKLELQQSKAARKRQGNTKIGLQANSASPLKCKDATAHPRLRLWLRWQIMISRSTLSSLQVSPTTHVRAWGYRGTRNMLPGICGGVQRGLQPYIAAQRWLGPWLPIT